MEIRPPGFLIRGWSQEMWFRPLLGGGCVNSTVRPHRPMDETFHQNDPDGKRDAF